MTTPAEPLPAVCVLGLGLIGGSLLRALAPMTSTWGWSRSPETRAAADDSGFQVVPERDAALERAAAEGAVVVAAVPIPAMPSVLQAVGRVAPHVRLTDVASVKVPIAEHVAAFAPSTQYVGSHPMAGTEHSGWSAGSAELFRDAAWVTCLDDDTDVDAWAAVARIALGVGSRVIPASAEAHDDAVARISHLPHLLALALATVGADGGPLALSLAATSFADGSRVAGTRPELIRAMCESNRAALVDALDEALGQIGVARASLASTGSLQRLTAAGHQARRTFDQRGTDLQRVELVGPDLVDQLLAIGAGGGSVIGIHGADAAPRITALASPYRD